LQVAGYRLQLETCNLQRQTQLSEQQKYSILGIPIQGYIIK